MPRVDHSNAKCWGRRKVMVGEEGVEVGRMGHQIHLVTRKDPLATKEPCPREARVERYFKVNWDC